MSVILKVSKKHSCIDCMTLGGLVGKLHKSIQAECLSSKKHSRTLVSLYSCLCCYATMLQPSPCITTDTAQRQFSTSITCFQGGNKAGCGGTYLYSQHSGGKDRKISVSSRATLSTKQISEHTGLVHRKIQSQNAPPTHTHKSQGPWR